MKSAPPSPLLNNYGQNPPKKRIIRSPLYDRQPPSSQRRDGEDIRLSTVQTRERLNGLYKYASSVQM